MERGPPVKPEDDGGNGRNQRYERAERGLLIKPEDDGKNGWTERHIAETES